MATRDEMNSFSMMIESLANRLKISHIDAITYHCELVDMEVEVAATLVNDSLKSKIELEAQNLNYLEKSSRLPLED